MNGSFGSTTDTLSFKSRISPSIVVCLVGDTHVGKTSLTERVAHNTFSRRSGPTIGGDFRSVPSKGREGQNCMLMLRDTSGDEAYRSIVPMFFRGVEVAVLVFDVTSRSSLNSVPFWASTVRKHDENKLKALILCGNKTDLVDDERSNGVTRSDGKQMARRLNCHGYFETSALTGEGIKELTDLVIDCGLQSEQYPKVESMCGLSQDLGSASIRLVHKGNDSYLEVLQTFKSSENGLSFRSCCS